MQKSVDAKKVERKPRPDKSENKRSMPFRRVLIIRLPRARRGAPAHAEPAQEGALRQAEGQSRGDQQVPKSAQKRSDRVAQAPEIRQA